MSESVSNLDELSTEDLTKLLLNPKEMSKALKKLNKTPQQKNLEILTGLVTKFLLCYNLKSGSYGIQKQSLYEAFLKFIKEDSRNKTPSYTFFISYLSLILKTTKEKVYTNRRPTSIFKDLMFRQSTTIQIEKATLRYIKRLLKQYNVELVEKTSKNGLACSLKALYLIIKDIEYDNHIKKNLLSYSHLKKLILRKGLKLSTVKSGKITVFLNKDTLSDRALIRIEGMEAYNGKKKNKKGSRRVS